MKISTIKLAIYFLLIQLLSGCNTKQQALAFNNKIARLSNGIADKGAAIGQKLKAALSSHNFSQLKQPFDDISETMKNDINELTNLKNVAGSEDLKSFALYYFTFENNLIEKCFMPFAAMNEKTTESEIQTALTNLKQGIKDEEPVLARFKEKQHEYASKNGFTIAGDY